MKQLICSLCIITLLFAVCSCTVTEPQITDPVTEPITEPITDPVTDPVTDLITEPVTEPVTDPITEPVTEPVTEPATEPVTDVTVGILDYFINLIVTPETIKQAPADYGIEHTSLTLAEQESLLAELYYIGADGYIHIEGSENIRLPVDWKSISLPSINAGGEYLPAPTVVAYSSLRTTVSDGFIPAYSSSGTNSTSYMSTAPAPYFNFSDGESSYLPETILALAKCEEANVSVEKWYIEGNRACAAFRVFSKRNDERCKFSVIVTTTDKGESYNVAVLDTDFGSDFSTDCVSVSFISDSVGYLIYESNAEILGRVYHTVLKTVDGGKSFVFLDGTADFGKNAVFLDESRFVSVGYKYNGIYKAHINIVDIANTSKEREFQLWHPDVGSLKEFGFNEYPLLGNLHFLTPYFDGDIGVVAAEIYEDAYYKDGCIGYLYFVTLNGGYTWTSYSLSENDVVSLKYPKTEVEISEDDIYAPIVLDGATPFALGVELPTEGCFVHAWQNEYYEGPAMKYDMGVHFVSSKLANRMRNDPSVWVESTLILSEHLQYKLVMIYAAGMRILSITYPDGTEVQEHVAYNWYGVTPIDKVGNTVRFIFGCDTKLPPGSTDYLNRYTLYEITLSDDRKSVETVNKYDCPGEIVDFYGDNGIAQRLIYSDEDMKLDFYCYYTTADGGKTWTEYLPNVEGVEPIRVERLLPFAK